MDFKTADLCDRFDARVSVCDPVFRDYGGLQRFAGAISTVKCFEDNSLVKAALGQPGMAEFWSWTPAARRGAPY